MPIEAPFTDVIDVTTRPQVKAGVFAISERLSPNAINANMTLGITVDQGAADDEAFALKSSDVAHGTTAVAETDTYSYQQKIHAAGGGLFVRGITSAAAADARALILAGLGASASTTKTSASTAAVVLQASTKSGVNEAAIAADGNLVAIRNLNTTVALFDAEGTLHLDLAGVGSVAAPSLTLGGDVDTGLYPYGANQVGMVGGGILCAWWSGTRFFISGNHYIDFAGSNGLIRHNGGAFGFNFYSSTYYQIDVGTENGPNSLRIDDGDVANPAGNDTAGGDIHFLLKDGGTSTGVGRAGASFYVSAGVGSAAGLGTGLAGGDGGSVILTPGAGGAGDGAGAAGLAGQVNVNIAGSATRPSLIIAGDDNTGLYSYAADQLGISCLGAARAVIHPNGVWTRDGAVGAPSLGFILDTTSGFYRIGASQIGLTLGGVLNINYTTTQTRWNFTGSAALPAIANNAWNGTGIYWTAADQLSVTCATAESLRVTPTAIQVGVSGLTFLVDTDTGVYRANANVLGLAAGGAPLAFSNAAITLAAQADTPGANIYSKLQDGGVATAAGQAGATYRITAGSGSAAGGAGPANGGAGGSLILQPGAGGAGVGGGTAGAKGDVQVPSDYNLSLGSSSQFHLQYTSGSNILFVETLTALPGVSGGIINSLWITAGGAAAASLFGAVDSLDGQWESGLLAETDGAGSYREPVFKLPFYSGAYGGAWGVYTEPSPNGITGGCAWFAYNSSTAETRLYMYNSTTSTYWYVDMTEV